MTRCVFMGTPEFAVPSLGGLAGRGLRHRRRADQGRSARGPRPEAGGVAGQTACAGPRPDDPAAADAAHRRGPGRAGRPRAGRDRGRGLRPDPAPEGARPAPVRLHQRPRLGAAAWRGAAPIAAAILAGDVEAGVSIMRMDAGVDTGPTLSAAYLPIAADDTTGTLTPKLAALGADLLMRTLPRWLAGELVPHAAAGGGRHLRPTHH